MIRKIKSFLILKTIFAGLKEKRKLNLIRYNKHFLYVFNVTKDDFECFKHLNIFNTKYNTDIQDRNISTLNIAKKYIGNEGLSIIEKIKFRRIDLLYLNSNLISKIDILENYNLSSLIAINLANNFIDNISVFSKLNLKNLILLDLSSNKIEDISVLGKINFENLQTLNLSNNIITDTSSLQHNQMKKLNELNLSRNRISNFFGLVNFKLLIKLNLESNRITDRDINALRRLEPHILKELRLAHNKISDISLFCNPRYKHIFSHLKVLTLNDNAFDRDDPIIYSMIGDIIAFNSIKYAKIY